MVGKNQSRKNQRFSEFPKKIQRIFFEKVFLLAFVKNNTLITNKNSSGIFISVDFKGIWSE